MPSNAPAFVTVNPSFIEPGILLPYTQASGFLELFAGGDPLVKISPDDQYIYAKGIHLRTQIAGGQSAYNLLPTIETTPFQISTPTYLLRSNSQFDHHDISAMGRWGVSLMEINRLGHRQGMFQLMRTAAIMGMNPANGEGLLNAQGATAINLPPDSNGNTTASTYDNGQMAFFLMNQVASIKSKTNNLGIGRKFSFLMPQRIGQLFQYNVVQLVQFQRAGAGSDSTVGVLQTVLAANGDEISWGYDDTLIGQGAGGTDLMIITMPEVAKPRGMKINTNEFAKLAPGMDATMLIYCDRPAPTEIPVPIAFGATSILYEMKISSGWAVRPEALTLLSIPFP